MIGNLLKSKIVKNSGWIIGGKVVQMLIGLLVGVITARYLGPSNYGLINIASSYTTFVMPLCNLAFQSIFVKYIIDHPDKEGVYLGSGIGMRCIAGTLIMAAMLPVVMLMHPGEWELHLVFFVHSFVLLFQAFDLFDYWYQSKYQSKYPAIFSAIGYSSMALYRILLLITGKSVVWFAFATVLDYVVIAIIYMVYTVPKNKLRLRFSWRCGREMLGTSKHFIASGMLVMVYAQTDKIMIGKFMSNVDVGLYSVGVAICNMWTFILQAIINSVRPDIVETYRVDKERYKRKLVLLYSVIIWLSIAVSCVICVLAKWAVLLLYGRSYLGAISALRIVTWYTGFSYLGVARNIWTVCEEKQRYEKVFALSGAVSNLLMNLALIPLLGITGAAIASLATQIITNVIVPFCMKNTRENSLHILKAFDPRNLLYVVKKQSI